MRERPWIAVGRAEKEGVGAAGTRPGAEECFLDG
jgi:hypothetical protein